MEVSRLAAEIARRHGIEEPVRPLRKGGNHVFRAGDVVIRVAPESADVAAQVRLARWLASEGFPVATPTADEEVVEGVQVSLWEYIEADEGRPIDYRRLGELVARLHRVGPAQLRDVVELPFCGDAAWLAVERRLDEAAAAGLVEGEGLEALRRESAALSGWEERARGEELVVCHGDVHPQNVLMRAGEVVIIDWDAICLGPPAWDHAPLMTWADRWGGAEETYSDFARGYGADLRGSPLARELAAVRLLAPTLNMIAGGASDPAYAAEARVRMRYWLGDTDAPAWTPL
jgi:Ser/Thr protein kinase RdoA (MazF antagonist)